MATSQNGWSVVRFSLDPRMAPFRWVTGRTRKGDATVIFDHLCSRFHASVEPIKQSHSWGYAYRSVRGAKSGYSNHASGTAIDLNAPAHPLGKRNTFTDRQENAIRVILRELDGTVRWGGDYSNRADEMHFEINASAAKVKQVANRLRGATPKAKPRNLVPPRRYVVTADRLHARRAPSMAGGKNVVATRKKGFRFTGRQIAVDPESGRTFIRAVARWYDATHLDLVVSKKKG